MAAAAPAPAPAPAPDVDQFMRAARRGDLMEVDRQLALGIDVNAEVRGLDVNDEDQGLTALSTAAAHGQVEVVQRLLQVEGIDVNSSSPQQDHKTPLIFAIINHQYRVVELLLQDPRVNVNHFAAFGTALRYATVVKNRPIITLLLENEKVDTTIKQDRAGRIANIQAISPGDPATWMRFHRRPQLLTAAIARRAWERRRNAILARAKVIENEYGDNGDGGGAGGGGGDNGDGGGSGGPGGGGGGGGAGNARRRKQTMRKRGGARRRSQTKRR